MYVAAIVANYMFFLKNNYLFSLYLIDTTHYYVYKSIKVRPSKMKILRDISQFMQYYVKLK